MKKGSAAWFMLVTLTAGPAIAEQGFSAGASIGHSTVELRESGLSADFDSVGYKVFAGYMFNDNFGFEGGWVDFGSADENILGSNVEINTDGFDLFAVGAVPVSDSFDLFAKAGFLSWDVGASIDGFDLGSDSGEDLALGFGGRFKTRSGFGLRAEYEWFDIPDTDSAWMLSIGFDYAFK
jgi:OOP family OmpA-OmpF porin